MARINRETDKCTASKKQLSIPQAFADATHYEKTFMKMEKQTDSISYYIVKGMAPIAAIVGLNTLLKPSSGDALCHRKNIFPKLRRPTCTKHAVKR